MIFVESKSKKYVTRIIYLEVGFQDLIDTTRAKALLTSKTCTSVDTYSEIGPKYRVQEQKLKNSSFTPLLAKLSNFPHFFVF